MNTVVSADGTAIAYSKVGQGPAVILVDGAMCFRAMGPAEPLAKLLADAYTVYTYDRRGRGGSGDTAPYAVEREIEDLDALIKEAGGSAYLYGISSGAVLACDAAARLGGVRKLAVYEPPFVVDGTHEARPADYLDKMDAMIAQDRRGDAVTTFMRTVGVPGLVVAIMKLTPNFKKLKAVAHTLPYDFRVLGDTGRGQPLNAARWAGAQLPALVMDGGKSPVYMRNGAKALSQALPSAGYRTLPGQTHLLKPEAVAPVLKEFFVD
ncbi:alpha/beta fold hydrolase [Catellatospora citrea]|uniref:Alpha/beta hydrolase n=1 Tax=Catellatospora citrea TaxID=53366 RepID=A0A8J3P3R9_9ACTN|nr:alpha/beta hydrolase [Catellatospora citrea]RKE10894.1 pimeloyl-ACP methyl ester carboxylesterase [Catellatospora citrea]GIG03108.1 alpha/beta hydrolase [Catellatospora citrea]